jgi:hypothetical protein
MEIPTARIMKTDTYRAGAGQVYPYRYYYLAFSPLNRVEIDGRATEIIGVKRWEAGTETTKTKRWILNSNWWRRKYGPALSLGIMDPQGTRSIRTVHCAQQTDISL